MTNYLYIMKKVYCPKEETYLRRKRILKYANNEEDQTGNKLCHETFISLFHIKKDPFFMSIEPEISLTVAEYVKALLQSFTATIVKK